MITLVTGNPGSSKTSYVVQEMYRNSISPHPRPYFTNINGIDNEKLRSFPLEDGFEYKLDEMPAGSIIVIDECQHFYPPRPSSSKIPDHIAFFNIHRHSGIDVILITQGPMLIDHSIRDCIGRHVHLTKPFGRKLSNFYEWNSCNPKPEPNKSFTNAVKSTLKVDQDVFGFYKSTELDTHKSRFPKKIIIKLSAIVIIGLIALIYTITNFSTMADEEEKTIEPKIEDIKPIEPVLPEPKKNKLIPIVPDSITSKILDGDSEEVEDKTVFIKGSIIRERFNDSSFYLSSGHKLKDFLFREYDYTNQKIYLCHTKPCDKYRNKYVLEDYKYFVQLARNQY